MRCSSFYMSVEFLMQFLTEEETLAAVRKFKVMNITIMSLSRVPRLGENRGKYASRFLSRSCKRDEIYQTQERRYSI